VAETSTSCPPICALTPLWNRNPAIRALATHCRPNLVQKDVRWSTQWVAYSAAIHPCGPVQYHTVLRTLCQGIVCMQDLHPRALVLGPGWELPFAANIPRIRGYLVSLMQTKPRKVFTNVERGSGSRDAYENTCRCDPAITSGAPLRGDDVTPYCVRDGLPPTTPDCCIHQANFWGYTLVSYER
jgi:hypothetical protein